MKLLTFKSPPDTNTVNCSDVLGTRYYLIDNEIKNIDQSSRERLVGQLNKCYWPSWVPLPEGIQCKSELQLEHYSAVVQMIIDGVPCTSPVTGCINAPL